MTQAKVSTEIDEGFEREYLARLEADDIQFMLRNPGEGYLRQLCHCFYSAGIKDGFERAAEVATTIFKGTK